MDVSDPNFNHLADVMKQRKYFRSMFSLTTTYTDQDALCIAIDLTHDCDLPTLFVEISLIDADGVRPKVSRGMRQAHTLEYLIEVRSYLQNPTVALDVMIALMRTPDV